MKNKLLTVVIPTYNMEKYLENCLDSFIFDKDETGLEILIVNDGSKDSSLEIAKKYESRYPDIFKVIDKENGGHGSTINAGLKVAKGKYFKVVDADDWVDTKEFEKLFNQLKELDVDCVITNYSTYYEDKKRFELNKCVVESINTILNVEDIKEFKYVMHTETFKTDVIKDVRLQEHCFYVDVEYNLYSYARCNKFLYLDLNVYQYRVGRAGQSMSPNGLLKHRDNHKTVIFNIINFAKTYSFDGVKLYNINKYISSIIRSQYLYSLITYKLDKIVAKELKLFDDELKQYDDFYKLSNEYKLVKSLRKHNFKNIGFLSFARDCKQILKKLIGR